MIIIAGTANSSIYLSLEESGLLDREGERHLFVKIKTLFVSVFSSLFLFPQSFSPAPLEVISFILLINFPVPSLSYWIKDKVC